MTDLEDVIQTWESPGRRSPEYHALIKRTIREAWPELGNALDKAVRASKVKGPIADSWIHYTAYVNRHLGLTLDNCYHSADWRLINCNACAQFRKEEIEENNA